MRNCNGLFSLDISDCVLLTDDAVYQLTSAFVCFPLATNPTSSALPAPLSGGASLSGGARLSLRGVGRRTLRCWLRRRSINLTRALSLCC